MKHANVATRPLDMRSPYTIAETAEYLTVYFQFLFVPLCVVAVGVTFITQNIYHLLIGLLVVSVPLLFVTYKRVPFLYLANVVTLGIVLVFTCSAWSYYYPPAREIPQGMILLNKEHALILPPEVSNVKHINGPINWENIPKHRIALVAIQHDQQKFYYPCVVVEDEVFVVRPEHKQFLSISQVNVEANTFIVTKFSHVMQEQPLQESYQFILE
jgi:hypothetical protein